MWEFLVVGLYLSAFIAGIAVLWRVHLMFASIDNQSSPRVQKPLHVEEKVPEQDKPLGQGVRGHVISFVETVLNDKKRFTFGYSKFGYRELTDTVTGDVFITNFSEYGDIWVERSINDEELREIGLSEREKQYILNKLAMPYLQRRKRYLRLKKEREIMQERRRLKKIYCGEK